MMAISPRNRLIATLVVAGVGLALFFGGEYRDIGFPLGWIGTFLFVAAVWYCVDLVHRVPHSDDEAVIAPGEWQAWVGVAFGGAVIAAAAPAADVVPLPVPLVPELDPMGPGR